MKGLPRLLLLSALVCFSVCSADEKYQPKASAPHIEDGDAPARPSEPEKGERPRTSQAFDEASEAVEKMKERDKKELPTITAEYVKRIKEGMDNGKLYEELSGLMTERESYGDAEHKPVFGDLFDKLSETEKTEITMAYTRARRENREMLHDAVKNALKDSKDPRIQALFKEDVPFDVERERKKFEAKQRPGSTQKFDQESMFMGLENWIGKKMSAWDALKAVNLSAYDEGLKRIKDNKLDRPICFTCGEQVSDRNYWDFAGVMTTAASLTLQNLSMYNPDKKAWYGGDKFSRTSDGRIISRIGMGNDGKVYAYTDGTNTDGWEVGANPGFVADLRKAYQNAPLMKAHDYNVEKAYGNDAQKMRNFFNWADNTVLPPKSPNLAAAGMVNNTIAKTVAPLAAPALAASVQAYLDTVDGHPTAEQYPKPEDMAQKLGLIDPDGKSYVTWKSVIDEKDPKNNKPMHFDGTSEFGVKVRWDAIRFAEPDERARVMGILKSIAAEPGPARYKVDNKGYGYCIWCNIRNDSTSVSNMSSIK